MPLETTKIHSVAGVLDPGSGFVGKRAITQQGFSARAHDRILKVARTIADIEDTPAIEPKHTAEAIQYRSLDRTCRT